MQRRVTRQSLTTATVLILLAVAGCRASTSDTVIETPSSDSSVSKAGTATPTPTTSPTPTPSSSVGDALGSAATIAQALASQLGSIASNFDVAAYLRPSWGTGAIAGQDGDGMSGVGAFRFLCTPSHLAKDDPIVYPGQPGRSHLHQFFGNTATDANSTYTSLRTTGESTCGNKVNRSAYWVPAMMNGKGKVVRPISITVYYKRLPESDAECQRQGKACVPLPRGLRFVFGYNMLNPAQTPPGLFHFICSGAGADDTPSLDLVTAASRCPAGGGMIAQIEAPDCWDGVHLDTPDHRSHLAYGDYGTRGYLRCPDTHPYVIPRLTLTISYNVDADFGGWFLSSDQMAGMPASRSGSTFHADYFEAWDDDALKAWSDNCINKRLSCTGGDLGNGKQIIGADVWQTGPQLVDPPA